MGPRAAGTGQAAALATHGARLDQLSLFASDQGFPEDEVIERVKFALPR